MTPSMAHQKQRFAAFDIVVVPFPYADRLAEKRRPALVISNRKLSLHGLIWVAMITSAENESWSSDVAIVDINRSGLPAPSVVRVAKIACIEPGRIDRRIGRLGKAEAKAVGQRLRGFWVRDEVAMSLCNQAICNQAIISSTSPSPHSEEHCAATRLGPCGRPILRDAPAALLKDEAKKATAQPISRSSRNPTSARPPHWSARPR
jgi:mRNA interferase MazF